MSGSRHWPEDSFRFKLYGINLRAVFAILPDARQQKAIPIPQLFTGSI